MHDDVQLLEAAIKESKLSVRKFADTIVMRDERTVRRWLDRSSPMPVPVVKWLRAVYGAVRGKPPEGPPRDRSQLADD